MCTVVTVMCVYRGHHNVCTVVTMTCACVWVAEGRGDVGRCVGV